MKEFEGEEVIPLFLREVRRHLILAFLKVRICHEHNMYDMHNSQVLNIDFVKFKNS